jgi:hypothetical protein
LQESHHPIEVAGGQNRLDDQVDFQQIMLYSKTQYKRRAVLQTFPTTDQRDKSAWQLQQQHKPAARANQPGGCLSGVHRTASGDQIMGQQKSSSMESIYTESL